MFPSQISRFLSFGMRARTSVFSSSRVVTAGLAVPNGQVEDPSPTSIALATSDISYIIPVLLVCDVQSVTTKSLTQQRLCFGLVLRWVLGTKQGYHVTQLSTQLQTGYQYVLDTNLESSVIFHKGISPRIYTTVVEPSFDQRSKLSSTSGLCLTTKVLLLPLWYMSLRPSLMQLS